MDWVCWWWWEECRLLSSEKTDEVSEGEGEVALDVLDMLEREGCRMTKRGGAKRSSDVGRPRPRSEDGGDLWFSRISVEDVKVVDLCLLWLWCASPVLSLLRIK